MDLGIPIIDLPPMEYLAEPIYLGGLASKPNPQRFVIESPEKLPKVEPEQVGFNIYCTVRGFSFNGVFHEAKTEPQLFCRVYFNCEESAFGVRDSSGNFHPFNRASGDKIVFRY